MTKEAIEAAAHELAAVRTERRQIDRLPVACRPGNDEDALAIQQRTVQLLGDQVGGWKCSVPRGDHVFLAPLLASTIRSGSRCPVVSNNGVARIEPEVAFILAKDLSPRVTSYTENDLRHAIADTRLVLEIIGSRLVDPAAVPFVEFLADSINNQGLFVGPPVSNPFERQLESLRITVSAPSGTLITHQGRHPNVHPLRPLLWLTNFFSSRGETLRAGAVVTTGSYAGILEVPLDTALSVSYGDLGRLDVIFEMEQQ